MVYDGIAYTTSSLTVTIADVNEAPSFSKNLYYANGDEGSVIYSLDINIYRDF